MKNNFSLAYSVILIISDALALLVALVSAYIFRVSISDVPVSREVYAQEYLQLIVSILPFWILIFALLGLYGTRVYANRFSELVRLGLGSVIGIMGIISYQYLANIDIFPARKVVLYGLLLAFLLVLIFRTVLRIVRRLMFAYGVGINRVLLIGDNKQTIALATVMAANNPTGDRVVAIVGDNRHQFDFNHQFLVFKDFDQAVKGLSDKPPTTIVQTELYADSDANDKILNFAQTNHIDYRFVPGHDNLFVGNIDVELFHSVPMVAVHQTPLIGWGRVTKRLTDVLLSAAMLIITSPIILLTALAIWVSRDGSIFFRQARLTRFNRVFRVFKFRSQYAKYDGTTPEEAFAMMGKPELAKEYRLNGDHLPNDPRVTRIGRFIRRTSIDELPQLFNVLKGDLSLVGPRALIPAELDAHQRKHTILSVKSGLTGLAQISGRRDINFEERRRLDIYYVQNWSLWGDLVILAKTFWVVVTGRGAN